MVQSTPVVAEQNVEEDVVRRTSIPFKPNKSASLWSIMKNSIGKVRAAASAPVS
jgi:hypothetical protein